ncbi:MAG: NADP-dependent oxidoreductase [Methylobacteriaceae bacterium]|nr:NADP-dependent oxidoreductase [Methylobacteriaceae bacterium]
MRAVVFDTFGDPSVLRITDVATPIPGEGEVVVAVAAAPVNPTDLMMRSGKQAALMTHLAPPYIAGMEFAGRVEAAGAGVALKPGSPVIGVVNPRRPAGGAHAEFVAVPAAQVAILSDAVDLVGASMTPMNALTALRALELTGLVRGQSLIVTGGAGVFGGMLLRLARHAGIRTIAGGAEADGALLRGLGADFVMPRDPADWSAFDKICPRGADALIDGALIGDKVSRFVREGGVAVALRKSNPITDARLSCVAVSVMDAFGRADWLAEIAGHVASGVLAPRIAEGGVFACSDAVAAHRMAESAHLRGRVILTFDAGGA